MPVGAKKYSTGEYLESEQGYQLSTTNSDALYDHYQDVIDKFPEEVHQILMPEDYEKKKMKQLESEKAAKS